MNDRNRKREMSKGQQFTKGEEESGRVKFIPVLAWLSCFFFFAFLVLIVAFFFQSKLTFLQEELSSLKKNLSTCNNGQEEITKILRKRSSDEAEEESGSNSGIQAAHLQGSIPLQHIHNYGRIGPWYLSTTDVSFLSLHQKNTEVEISQSGVYYIYAQVYYLTSEPYNSFQILVHNGTDERRQHRSVAMCSCQGRNTMAEVSCFTGLVVGMNAGERLYLNQVEQNRIIQFSNGCSYFGLVLLKKNAVLKRKKHSTRTNSN